MLRALRHAAFVVFCVALSGDAFAAEPIRIDRPAEGAKVETEIEVGGVATPGATVEVWVDQVFVVDTIAEPDGWYVTTITRPPGATDKSRIFVHELNGEGQRVSSAVVRVVWSEQPVPEEPVPPPPAVAVDGPIEPPPDGRAVAPPDGEVSAETDGPQPRNERAGRVAVEYLTSAAAGITGAIIGAILASAVGQPDSGVRTGATVLLGSIGGSMASAGAVYGVGTAMQGNGSFAWTAVGAFGGAALVVTVGLATTDGAGGLIVPAAIVAFGLPVLAYELTSDVSRLESPAPTAQPTAGFTREGMPTIGFTVTW